MTSLTPVSLAIAVVLLAALVASFVLIAFGFKVQWRGPQSPWWLVPLIAVLLLVGVIGTWGIRRRFEVISAIYSNVYGQPSAVAPTSLFGFWPSVLLVSQATAAVGLAALVVYGVIAFQRTRRLARLGGQGTS